MTSPREQLISLADAWRVLAAHVHAGPIEDISLADAFGRTLARPVTAGYDYPPFHKATMDGFAVRAADTADAPRDLRVVGDAPAGAVSTRPIGPGEAMRINTGAPLPEGADAVVPVEETAAGRAPSTVRISTACRAGRHVAPRGSVRTAGQSVLEPPVILHAARLSAAAAAGAETLAVYRRPAVGIVVTGDELVPPGSTPAPGQIVESNETTLVALTRECGAFPVPLGIARDEPAELRVVLARALEHPVLIAVGGMSRGTLDLVPAAFEQLGVRWHYHGVNLRPGKPTAYGTGPAGQHVFGLPGNPVSALVCYLLFVRVALRGLCGFPPDPPAMLRLRLQDSIPAARDPRPAFLPALADLRGDGRVRPVEWRGSGDPFSIAAANSFLFHAAGDAAVESGTPIDVLPMPGLIG